MTTRIKQVTTQVKPRVRFAPAPTGYLHVGGARTALFNWLFARSHGGEMVLRIEDTDRERSRPEFEADIVESLRWLGLDWDEGPYRQSDRIPIYRKYLDQLLANGHAYYCFCSEEDLEAERQDMMGRGVAPRYSGRCRDLPREEVERRHREGERSVIRIRMPSRKISFNDLVRDKVAFDTEQIGDIVVAKGLDAPLFILTVTIDDFLMNITHVIRGEDLLPNVPKQIVIQEALGFSQPEYAHLPVILGTDRAKLSKRHGSTSIREYREMGYLPEALVNFMALLGWHQTGDREVFSSHELVEEFSLERVQKAGAVFDVTKLSWMNAKYIREKPPEDLLEMAKPVWEKVDFGVTKYDETYLLKVLSLSRDRLEKLSDLPFLTEFFFRRPEYNAELLQWRKMAFHELPALVGGALARLSEISEDRWSSEAVAQALEPLLGPDKGKLLWPLRVALSGREASPGPYELAGVLGKTETLARLHHAQNLVDVF